MNDLTKHDPQFSRFGSGKAVHRVEDADLLAGRGRFADDVSLTDQVFACFLRSPHPHARIVSIDTKAAAAMPGIIGIVTGDDLVRRGVKPLPNSADFKRPDGRPLPGALAAGLSPVTDVNLFGRGPLKTAEFKATGLRPGQPRALVFFHADEKLAMAP